MQPPSPPSVVDLRRDQEVDSLLAQLPTMPSILDSVTHVVYSTRVCGIRDDVSVVKFYR